jgi:proteasome assembly chaperone (PAC2) family protein
MDDDQVFDYILHIEQPELRSPVMVVSLEGWIDAGLGSSTAITTLLEAIDTKLMATFLTEYFIDQRARRPIVHIVNGVTTELTWPEIVARHGTDAAGKDFIVLVGPEPDFHWSDFIDIVVDLAERYSVRLVVGLGAFPAPTPHTRPLKVIGTAPEASKELLDVVGTVEGEIEVPAGIMAALEMGLAEKDVPVVTLWARVPHYVASMAYPQAAAALLDSLGTLTELRVNGTALREAADEARQRVDELVANNPEHSVMVHSLEATTDESEGTSLGAELPSGDELAAELERFLRGEQA